MKWLVGLFRHLDEHLEEDGCDNTMHFTAEFLRKSDDCGDCEGAGALSVSAYSRPVEADPMVGRPDRGFAEMRTHRGSPGTNEGGQSWHSARGATGKGAGRSSRRGGIRMKAHRVGTNSPDG